MAWKKFNAKKAKLVETSKSRVGVAWKSKDEETLLDQKDKEERKFMFQSKATDNKVEATT